MIERNLTISNPYVKKGMGLRKNKIILILKRESLCESRCSALKSFFKSKAVVLVGLRKIEVREFDVPEVKPKDLLIKVELSGICGTDIHMIYSKKPFPERPHLYPQILGHETVGTIVKMGSEAPRFDATGRPLKIGDRITLLSGRVEEANPFLYGWGRGWATYRYIHGETARIYKISEKISPEVGILIEPMSVAVKAVERALEPTSPVDMRGMGPGKTVVVQGSGPIGLMVTIVAKLCGASEIVVLGAPEMRLKMCKEFGADHTINIEEVRSSKERVAKVKELIPEGADVVFEAAGVPQAFAEGIEMVRIGGVYVEIGHFTDRGVIPINPYILCRKDINLYGSWGAGPYGFVLARRIVEAYYKEMPLEKIVTHKFSLEEAEKAIETVRTGECMKAAFAPQMPPP